MRVAIVGSRDWPSPDRVEDYVLSLAEDDVVITGAWWSVLPDGRVSQRPTRGVDRWAADAAQRRGLVVALVAGSPKHDKMAGFRRNPVVVDLADKVVGFTLGTSGTRHTLTYAKKQGKPIVVFQGDGTQVELFALTRDE